MRIRSNVLPPTIKVQQPNPNLNIDDTPLYINTEMNHGFVALAPHRAGAMFWVWWFQFSCLLEEYTGPNKAPRLRVWGHELCLYSAEVQKKWVHSAKCLNRHDKVSLIGVLNHNSHSLQEALRLLWLHLG